MDIYFCSDSMLYLVAVWSDAKCTIQWLFSNMNSSLNFSNCVPFTSAVLGNLLTLYHPAHLQ